jgi:DNA-binding IclR family transcriptional regulator
MPSLKKSEQEFTLANSCAVGMDGAMNGTSPASPGATPAADASERAPVKSAARVLDIVEVLAAAPQGLSFTEIGRRLDLPKSSLHGLLATLTGRGYIAHDAERHIYSLGIRVWEHGQAYLRHQDLLGEAHRAMEAIVREINETVQLAVLDGLENVYLDKVDCSHPVRLQSEVGKRLEAHATGLGKVLLAFLPPDELEARLARSNGRPLIRFTPQTVTDQAALLRELEIVRRQGFAVDDQEYTPGLICVAVPIREQGGRVATAMSASIPTMRASPEQLVAALQALARGSLRLSNRMGLREDDPRMVALTRATPEMVMKRFRRRE